MVTVATGATVTCGDVQSSFSLDAVIVADPATLVTRPV
jgi:hypothetical protein